MEVFPSLHTLLVRQAKVAVASPHWPFPPATICGYRLPARMVKAPILVVASCAFGIAGNPFDSPVNSDGFIEWPGACCRLCGLATQRVRGHP